MKKAIILWFVLTAFCCMAKMRLWTDAKGRVIKAELVSLTDHTVTLRRDDGLERTIRRKELSSADQAYLEATEWLQQGGQIRPASEDPFGIPDIPDSEVLPASEDPFGIPDVPDSDVLSATEEPFGVPPLPFARGEFSNSSSKGNSNFELDPSNPFFWVHLALMLNVWALALVVVRGIVYWGFVKFKKTKMTMKARVYLKNPNNIMLE